MLKLERGQQSSTLNLTFREREPIFRPLFLQALALALAIHLAFFIFFHIPDAVANPYTMHGNEIVRAIVALLFCGIALVIASTNCNKSKSLAQV